MKIDRQRLRGELRLVEGGLTAKPEIEQSDCFVFQGGEVLTFNDDVACRTKTSLAFTGAVNARKLIDMLEQWPEESIEFKRTPGRLQFRGKAKQGYFTTQDVITLPVKDVETPHKWRKIPEEFWQAVQLVLNCAAHKSESPHLNCVHFSAQLVQACDGVQAGRYPTKTPFSKSTLLQSISLKSLSGLKLAGVSETDNWVHFRRKAQDPVTVSCRKCWEEYPSDRLDHIFSLKGTPATLPKSLRNVVDRLSVFLDEGNFLEVDITPTELKVAGRGIYGKQVERQPTKYKGKPFSFNINPKLFRNLAQKYNRCFLSDSTIRMEQGKFQYVTALLLRDEKETE